MGFPRLKLLTQGLALAEKLLIELQSQNDNTLCGSSDAAHETDDAAEQNTAAGRTSESAPELPVKVDEPQVIALYLNRSKAYTIAVISVLASG